MTHLEQLLESNKNKTLINLEDVCISRQFGIGYVVEVAPEDVYYPIQVLFKQNIFEFGILTEKRKYCHYDTKGCTNSIVNHDEKGDEIIDAKFYKLIKF